MASTLHESTLAFLRAFELNPPYFISSPSQTLFHRSISKLRAKHRSCSTRAHHGWALPSPSIDPRSSACFQRVAERSRADISSGSFTRSASMAMNWSPKGPDSHSGCR